MMMCRHIVCFAMLLIGGIAYPFTSPLRVTRNLINARLTKAVVAPPKVTPITSIRYESIDTKIDTSSLLIVSPHRIHVVNTVGHPLLPMPPGLMSPLDSLSHRDLLETVPDRLLRQGLNYFRDSLYSEAYSKFVLASITNPDACAMRVYCLEKGLGTERNDSLASSITSYYSRENAAIYYHHFFAEEIKDRFYANVLLMRMAESGDRIATFLLDAYDDLPDSLLISQEDRLGVAQRAAEAGNEWALYKLGRYALPDSLKAWEYWDAAAELGQPNALYEQWLRFGCAFNVHYRNYAVSCLNQAALLGVQPAVRDIIEYCLQIEQHPEALDWATYGASLGYTEAVFYLGYCYQFGIGTTADKNQAKELWITYLQCLSQSGMTNEEILDFAEKIECKPFLKLTKQLYK